MKKWHLVTTILFVGIAFVYSIGWINYPIYAQTGELNWGTSTGINGLFAGVIANVVELCIIIFCLWRLSHKAKKEAANPEGMTPVND